MLGDADENSDQTPSDLERPDQDRAYVEDDPDGGGDSSDDEWDELTSEECPRYFFEIYGRLYVSPFHSHGNIYPLPVDTPEQERLKVQHYCLKLVIGANYVGPVFELLSTNAGHNIKRVVDLGTGTGCWTLDMAREFPHVQFRGLDIVPIATRYPPSNVKFEIQDINERLRWNDGTVDLVHARSICMAIRNPASIIAEVSRILRPGGLFLWCEWRRGVTQFHPIFSENNASHFAPGLVRFWNAILPIHNRHNVPDRYNMIPEMLKNSGNFVDVQWHEYYIPLGRWQPGWRQKLIGGAMRKAFRRYAESYRRELLNLGWTEEGLAELWRDLEYDLRTIPGLVSKYRAVYARRI